MTGVKAASERIVPVSFSGRWKVRAACGLIALAIAAAFYNSLQGALVLDDDLSITQNPSIQHMWPLGPALSPPKDLPTSGRPLANLSFAFNYALGRGETWGYHVVNVVIHIGAALALFGVVRRTLMRLGTEAEGNRSRLTGDAWLLALGIAVLWAVHPLLTASVDYVSQRTEELMGLFYLVTLYAFIRGSERSPRAWWIVSVVACALGMASKEVMVTAPVVVLLYDRTFVAGTLREAWRRRWPYYLALAATWLLLALLMSTGLARRSIDLGLGTTWWRYALTESEAVLRYLWLVMWPRTLVFDYGPATGIDWTIALYAPALAVLVGGVWRACLRYPALGFVGACFFLVLAPTSSVVPVAMQPVAENRAYLPSAAVVTMGVLALHAVAGRRSMAVLVGLGVAATLVTLHRNETYRSSVGLWTDTLAKRPQNSRAHNNLGKILFEGRQVDAAIEHYKEALRIQPDYADALSNYGAALFQLNRIDEAIAYEERSLRQNPNLEIAHRNIAAAYLRVGRFQEALTHSQRALELNPNATGTHFNVGLALMNLGRVAESISCFEAELRLNPILADAECNWGAALFRLNRPSEAISHFEAALRLEPNHFRAQQDLASALYKLNRVPEAIQWYRAALKLKPDFVDAHRNLGVVLARTGRFPEATAEFEAVLRMQPGDSVARDGLAYIKASAPDAARPRN